MQLTLGQIYADKYRIVRLLGEGAMGAVYEAENTRIRRKVAIKILHPQIAQKADTLRRFEREAQAAGRIGSQHIVEVLDLGELADGSRFMVLEYLDGTTLDQRIRSRGRLTPEEATPIVCQLLEGLGAAHKAEIIHRDLKPANIYLCPKPGGVDFVKILDFGVSKFNVLNDEMSMTSTGAVLGTPYYMSPEQAKGSRAVDPRSDLYAVGVILYECITGQVPFSAETFNELIFRIVLESPPPVESFVPNLDPAFTAIIHKAMAREAGERFQTAEEFRSILTYWSERSAAGPGAPMAIGIGGTMLMDNAPGAGAGGQALDLESARTMAMEPRAPAAGPAWSKPGAPQGPPPPPRQPQTTEAFPAVPPGFDAGPVPQLPGLGMPQNQGYPAQAPNGYPAQAPNGYPAQAALPGYAMPMPGSGHDAPALPEEAYKVPKQSNGALAFVGGLFAVLLFGGAVVAVVKWKSSRPPVAIEATTTSATTAIVEPPSSAAVPVPASAPIAAATAPDSPVVAAHPGVPTHPGVGTATPKPTGKAVVGPVTPPPTGKPPGGKRVVSGDL
ncbi:MAG: serine/threonine-protein kinase [Byssovorax sp.]